MALGLESKAEMIAQLADESRLHVDVVVVKHVVELLYDLLLLLIRLPVYFRVLVLTDHWRLQFFGLAGLAHSLHRFSIEHLVRIRDDGLFSSIGCWDVDLVLERQLHQIYIAGFYILILQGHIQILLESDGRTQSRNFPEIIFDAIY